jgi:hypothetical protein
MTTVLEKQYDEAIRIITLVNNYKKNRETNIRNLGYKIINKTEEKPTTNIKTNYRNLIRYFHPDKSKPFNKIENSVLYTIIYQANDVISNANEPTRNFEQSIADFNLTFYPKKSKTPSLKKKSPSLQNQEKERQEREKQEREKQEREKQEREKQEREKQEREKQERENQEKEKQEKERQERKKQEKEKERQEREQKVLQKRREEEENKAQQNNLQQENFINEITMNKNRQTKAREKFLKENKISINDLQNYYTGKKSPNTKKKILKTYQKNVTQKNLQNIQETLKNCIKPPLTQQDLYYAFTTIEPQLLVSGLILEELRNYIINFYPQLQNETQLITFQVKDLRYIFTIIEPKLHFFLQTTGIKIKELQYYFQIVEPFIYSACVQTKISEKSLRKYFIHENN